MLSSPVFLFLAHLLFFGFPVTSAPSSEIYSATSNLTTLLSPNYLCYVEANGLRIVDRTTNLFNWGVFPNSLHKPEYAITEDVNNINSLIDDVTLEQIIANNTELPLIDDDIDYCLAFEQLVNTTLAESNSSDSISNLDKRNDKVDCQNKRCANDNVCYAINKKCSECEFDTIFQENSCFWDASLSQRGGTCYYCFGLGSFIINGANCRLAKGLRQCK